MISFCVIVLCYNELGLVQPVGIEHIFLNYCFCPWWLPPALSLNLLEINEKTSKYHQEKKQKHAKITDWKSFRLKSRGNVTSISTENISEFEFKSRNPTRVTYFLHFLASVLISIYCRTLMCSVFSRTSQRVNENKTQPFKGAIIERTCTLRYNNIILTNHHITIYVFRSLKTNLKSSSTPPSCQVAVVGRRQVYSTRFVLGFHP